MIKVALFSHTAYFAGAEKMLYSLAKLLKESGLYYPIIWIPENPNTRDLISACIEAEIEVFQMPALTWYTYISEENSGSIASDTYNQTQWTAQKLKNQAVSLVLCNALVSLVPLMAARKVGIPSVLWVHGILDGFLIPQGDLGTRLLLDRLAMYLSNQVVCCSHWTERYYRPISVTSICTINNWSESPKAIPLDVQFGKFICLNSFNHHKGLTTLLEAAVILKKSGYHFSIDLYGSGEDEETLRTFVYDKKLEKNIKFCGRTNAVAEIYQQCFCLVQPSYIEPFGLTITEAMSYARPVLATRSGGPEDTVIDGETGFLVPVKDAVALADKMKYLLDHPKEAEIMGLAGKKRYEDFFSPTRAKQEFLQLFDTVLSAPIINTSLDLLMEDTVIALLNECAGGHFLSSQTRLGKVPRSLAAVPLSFTGGIAKQRRYNVTCPTDSFQELGICFSSFGKALGYAEVSLSCG